MIVLQVEWFLGFLLVWTIQLSFFSFPLLSGYVSLLCFPPFKYPHKCVGERVVQTDLVGIVGTLPEKADGFSPFPPFSYRLKFAPMGYPPPADARRIGLSPHASRLGSSGNAQRFAQSLHRAPTTSANVDQDGPVVRL